MSKKISRRNRRIRNLLLVVSMMMVVAMASVGVTVAWLTDVTTSITNTFTTSGIEITLAENATDFKMIPGGTITKDPTVTVLEGSEPCYLFVKLEKENDFDNYMEYTMAAGWEALTNVNGVYVREVPASENATTITADTAFAVLEGNAVSVKDGVDAADMATANTSAPKLTVTAYACQSANIEDASAAWTQVSSLSATTND